MASPETNEHQGRGATPWLSGMLIDIPLVGANIPAETKVMLDRISAAMASAMPGWEVKGSMAKGTSGLQVYIGTSKGEEVTLDSVKGGIRDLLTKMPGARVSSGPAESSGDGLRDVSSSGGGTREEYSKARSGAGTGGPTAPVSEGIEWHPGQPVQLQITACRSPVLKTVSGETPLTFNADNRSQKEFLVGKVAKFFKGLRQMGNEAVEAGPFNDPDPVSYPQYSIVWDADPSAPERKLPKDLSGLIELQKRCPGWHELNQLIQRLEVDLKVPRGQTVQRSALEEEEANEDFTVEYQLRSDVNRTTDRSPASERQWKDKVDLFRKTLDDFMNKSWESKGTAREREQERIEVSLRLKDLLNDHRGDVRMLRAVNLGDIVKDELLIHLSQLEYELKPGSVPRRFQKPWADFIARTLITAGVTTGLIAGGVLAASFGTYLMPLGLAIGFGLLRLGLDKAKDHYEDTYKKTVLGMFIAAGQKNDIHFSLGAVRKLQAFLFEKGLVWYGGAKALPADPAPGGMPGSDTTKDTPEQRGHRMKAMLFGRGKDGRLRHLNGQGKLVDAGWLNNYDAVKSPIDIIQDPTFQRVKANKPELRETHPNALADWRYLAAAEKRVSAKQQVEDSKERTQYDLKRTAYSEALRETDWTAKQQRSRDADAALSRLKASGADPAEIQRAEAAKNAADAAFAAAEKIVAKPRADFKAAQAVVDPLQQQYNKEVAECRTIKRSIQDWTLNGKTRNSSGEKSEQIFQYHSIRDGQTLEGEFTNISARFGLGPKKQKDSLGLKLENVLRSERQARNNLLNMLKMEKAQRESLSTDFARGLAEYAEKGDLHEAITKVVHWKLWTADRLAVVGFVGSLVWQGVNVASYFFF